MSNGNLRQRLIRLAYEKPETRDVLLPILHEAREPDDVSDRVGIVVRSLKIASRQPPRMRMLGLSNGAVHLLRIIQEQGRGNPNLKHFAQRTLRETKLAINALLGPDDSGSEI